MADRVVLPEHIVDLKKVARPDSYPVFVAYCECGWIAKVGSTDVRFARDQARGHTRSVAQEAPTGPVATADANPDGAVA